IVSTLTPATRAASPEVRSSATCTIVPPAGRETKTALALVERGRRMSASRLIPPSMIAEVGGLPNLVQNPHTRTQNINHLRDSRGREASFFLRAVPIPPLLQPIVSSTPHRALSERGLDDLRRCQDEREQLPGLRQPVLQELLITAQRPPARCHNDASRTRAASSPG